MKLAILLIVLMDGGTSTIVPADKCESLASQARKSTGLVRIASCLYYEPAKQEARGE